MGSATDLDLLSKACEAGSEEACELLRRKRMAGFKDGGLLADASRTWKMESDYPEFEKGVANRLSKERIPEAEVEEQFQYSPLQRGYAEGGEVENFMDETGSLLQPEVPLDFEDEMGGEMTMEDDISVEDGEKLLDGLSPEDHEVLFQAMSDYPELEGILNTLSANDSSESFDTDVFDEEGSVEGAGTGTSDSINARLSDGEFVFTAKAVSHLGVDKLRKMMAKAEMDYDEADAKQQFAQMGDEGFATGGLLTKPKYGSYHEGGFATEGSGTKIRKRDLSPDGPIYSKADINKLVVQLSNDGMDIDDIDRHIVKLGNGKFKVKNFSLARGGLLDSGYPLGVTDKKGYDRMINQHYDEWSPSDGIPGEGNPHRGEKEIKGKGNLGTTLFELFNLDTEPKWNDPSSRKIKTV